MSTTDWFVHVTEREPGPWTDCSFAAMLETVRDGFPDGRDIPATVAEKEALRAAAGLPDDHTGATIGQAVTACERRYGLGGGYRITGEWVALHAALTDSTARCVVQGSMDSVPAHLRRWSPTFSGAHAVAARGPVWCDPLAPAGDYSGELVDLGTWESYFRGLSGAQALITRVGGLTRMSGDFVIYEPHVESRKRGAVRAGTVFYNDWALRERRGTFTAAATVQVLGYRGSAYAVEVNTAQGWPDGVKRPTNVFCQQLRVALLPDAEDPTPYTQADLDAAYERGRAEGDVKHTVTLQIDGATTSTTEV